MRDGTGASTSASPQPQQQRVEPYAGSAPVAPYGAPSLGLADRISFPIHAERAFGEGPEAGQ